MSNDTTPKMIPCPIVGEVCIHPDTIDCSTCHRIRHAHQSNVVTILENGEYTNRTGEALFMVGRSFKGINDLKKDQCLKNWNATDVRINDLARVVIEDSIITRLDVRGLCVLKNCKIDCLNVSMFANVFIVEGNDIRTLSIQGTVHSISTLSNVKQIELHCGGRVRLTTKDFQLGKPPQPKNLQLDMDREWYYGILSITKHEDHDEAEYWAFG